MAQPSSELLAGIAPGTRICTGTHGDHQFVITPDEIRIYDLQGELLHKIENRSQNVESWYRIRDGELLEVCVYEVLNLHTGKINRYSLPHGLVYNYITSCGLIVCSRAGIYPQQWRGVRPGAMNYIELFGNPYGNYEIALSLPVKLV